MTAGRPFWNLSVQGLYNFHCDEKDSGALRLLLKYNTDSLTGSVADGAPNEVKACGIINLLTDISSWHI
jgi:hypothetical protein